MRDPMSAFDGTSAPSDGITAEGYYRLPNVAGNRDELVAGEVIREPMPSFDHGAAAMRIARVVDDHVAQHRLAERSRAPRDRRSRGARSHSA